MHPPELPREPHPNSVIKQEASSKSDETEGGVQKPDPILECSEDAPFSPLRQSYTPIPSNVEMVEFEITEIGDAAEASSTAEAPANVVCNDLEAPLAETADRPVTVEDEEFDRVAIVHVSSEGVPDERLEETWPTPAEQEENIGEPYIMLSEPEGNAYNASASASSEPTSSTQSNFLNTAGSSRPDYGISSFLGYNEQHEGEFFYSGVRLSPIGFASENNPWNQRFSPQYAPFDVDKNSYMDLDLCKNTSSGDRAPSTDSLNIRTDEKMPAKGEISEQESNGDIDGSWSHQVRVI